MLNAGAILELDDRSTRAWHQDPAGWVSSPGAPGGTDALANLIARQHRANYDLWHQEDQARSPDASPATITQVKHAIDRLNQQRNDLVEQIDLMLLEAAGAQAESAPLHSETPGMIVDRLSILALKLYHTEEETTRTSATPEHRERNLARLAILHTQRADLAGCLDQLWADIVGGRRRFRLYRQMKMYNDPELNPVLYTRAVAPSPGD